MELLSFFAKLGLDKGDFDKGIEEAGQEAEGFAGKFAKAVTTVGSKAAGLTVKGIGALTSASFDLFGAIVDGSKEMSAYGDEIDKSSQKIGFSAKAYQEWGSILKYSGSSASSLSGIMQKLTQTAQKGSSAFVSLGYSLDEVDQMGGEELFESTIKALQNVEDETERTALAQQLFGRGAQELGPLLNTSAEDTEAMRQKVHDLGAVMGDDAVKASAQLQDSMQDMEMAIQGLKNGIMGNFLPGVSSVMEGLALIFSGDTNTGVALIGAGIDGLLLNLNEKMPEFLDVALGIIDALLDTFIKNLPDILEMGGTFLGKLVSGIILHIPDLVSSIPEIIKAFIDGLVAAWPDIKQAGIDLINVVWDGISSMWESVKSWGKDLIDNFVQGIRSYFGQVEKAAKDVAGIVDSYIGFSEPEKGPLSNFHTFGPDMMELFAKGITDNSGLIADSFKDALDFGITSVEFPEGKTAGGAKSAGYGAFAGQPIHLSFELVNELDGAIFSRKTFDYFIDEAHRRGEQLSFV